MCLILSRFKTPLNISTQRQVQIFSLCFSYTDGHKVCGCHTHETKQLQTKKIRTDGVSKKERVLTLSSFLVADNFKLLSDL